MMAHAWAFSLALCAATPSAPMAPAAAATPDAPAHWLDAPAVQAEATRHGPMAVGCALALLGFGAAGVYVLYRNQARPKEGALGGAIDVLAVKSLGGRQRLALVEVCGERLLLAATEREVTLISHLPGTMAEAEDAAVVDMAAADAATVVTPSPHVPVAAAARTPAEPQGLTVASMEAALGRAPAEESPSPFAADLAGLQRWHAQAQASERRA